MTTVRHVLRQGRVVATMGETVLRSLLQRLDLAAPAPGELILPGPEMSAQVAPLDGRLVSDYLRHVGGDPRAYHGMVPAHLFPQWSFPVLARTLRTLPFPLLKVVNGGCRLEMKAPLPAATPLEVRARLETVDDDGHRALLRQRVVTGPRSMPDAVSAEIFAVVPSALPRVAGTAERSRQDRARVPIAARELARWCLGADAGLTFATLTGDFNPIHWSRRYARLQGFAHPILHGFATLARAFEGLNRALFAGATDRMRVVDVRFTRPLGLPAAVGLYLEGSSFFVGDAPGGPAYLVGSFVAAAQPVPRPSPPGAAARQSKPIAVPVGSAESPT